METFLTLLILFLLLMTFLYLTRHAWGTIEVLEECDGYLIVGRLGKEKIKRDRILKEEEFEIWDFMDLGFVIPFSLRSYSIYPFSKKNKLIRMSSGFVRYHLIPLNKIKENQESNKAGERNSL